MSRTIALHLRVWGGKSEHPVPPRRDCRGSG